MRRILALATLLLLLNSASSLAWTSDEIAAAGKDDWIMQKVKIDPIASAGRVTIQYRLSEPAFVIVLAHAPYPPFPVIKTIVAREYRAAGPHTEQWDGLDEAGEKLPWLRWQVVVRAEPANFQPTEAELDRALLAPDVQPESLRASHHLHTPKHCGVFRIGLDFPDAQVGTTLRVRRSNDFMGYGDRFGVHVDVYWEDDAAKRSGKIIDVDLTPEQAKAKDYIVPIDMSGVPRYARRLRVTVDDHAGHGGGSSIDLDKRRAVR